MIHPIKFRTDDDPLVIIGDDLERLRKKPKQILWIRNGVYGLIPIETIKRVIRILPLSQNFCKFWWGEAIPIPKSTGQAMTEYNGEKNEM